ncbi:hypothetical protein phytr_3270 [Candidatus Phycorickettsia trachydisci]|uniref:Ankyrin repeat protein n=1 Tax=Candidatus Phycorickettsia trachydisci TaxID=2115978 RepID=A0A2P1P7P4_9RICK|nr:ankyrin repeat domain-containing protein [Candidatus Phycorickettsia trachydisci]AVP87281.1 hypothetical protein phytr_3270 [Candidatus Phycorickettsia trachydisci]
MNFRDHIELFQGIQSGRIEQVKSKLEALENNSERKILCEVVRYLRSFLQEEYTIDSPCHSKDYEEFVGLTLLECAIKNANLDIVKLLLDYGATPGEVSYLTYEDDTIGVTHSIPLITASESGNLEIVKLLLEYGASFNMINFPLLYAVKGNNPDMVEWFLENTLKPAYEGQWYELLDIAITNKNKNILAILIDDPAMALNPSEGRVLLCKAVKQNDISIVKFLIDKGLSSNSNALFPAIDNRNLEMLQLLLTHGFNDDINKEVSDYNMTALAWAMKSRYYEGVKCLLKYGANTNKLLWTDETESVEKGDDTYFELLDQYQDQSATEESKGKHKLLIGDIDADW